MEFLKSCSTNAQALGDFEAIAYQAFSITRDTTTPPAKPRDWNTSEDVRAVEFELRQARHLVAHDASRMWLWYLKPITVDKVGQDSVELPVLEGYRFYREQTAFLKASELARPPMRGPNPHVFSNPSVSSSGPSSQKSTHGGQARHSNSSSQASNTDLQPPDCLTLYELFTTSVIALVSYFLVKDCQVVALNYRTFVSKPALEQGIESKDLESPAHLSWLTSLSVHWTSSGTVIITTSTVRNERLRCLDDVKPGEQNDFVGSLVRVAPNASLARISSFEDPLKLTTEDLNQATRRKRAKFNTAEQSIERWKTMVKRWLGWRGYALPDLDKSTSWLRIRPARVPQNSVLSPGLTSMERDILWPRALCFHLDEDLTKYPVLPDPGKSDAKYLRGDMKWFEAAGTSGFKDPIDFAQEWFVGKPDRDRTAEARRKAMKAEEEAIRRKEEPTGLYPSSPLNARTGAYSDLQAVSGVYPTPPDGIVPAPTTASVHDTANGSSTSTNVILAPTGGAHPAINLSAPQDQAPSYGDEPATTSPLFPETSETYHASNYDDDLFEDIGADATGGMGLNEADFDFFDGPDDEDVQMTDASAMPQSTTEDTGGQNVATETPTQLATSVKEETSDPLTALENALATASHAYQGTTRDQKEELPPNNQLVPVQSPARPVDGSALHPKSPAEKSVMKRPTPPLSPSGIADALQASPSAKSAFRKNQQSKPIRRDSTFHPLDFSRRLTLADAKYQDGRFADQRDTGNDHHGGPEWSPEITRPKSLRDIPLMTKLRYAAGIASTSMIPEVTSLARAASDNSDTSSETSEESGDDIEDEAPIAAPSFPGRLIIPAKRKLPTEGNATPLSVTSFAESLGGDWFEFHGLQLDDVSLASLEPSSCDWSMLDLVNPSERPLAGARYTLPALPPPPTQLPDTPTSQPDLSIELGDEKPAISKDSIIITQIVTEQVVFSTLDLLGDDSRLPSKTASAAESRWQNLVKAVFPNAVDCAFPALAAVHDIYPDLPVQVKGQQRPPPRKPNESAAVPGNQLYQINPPFIRVRRADNYWDLLPPSVAFWEALGLAPASSPKNAVAFCVYPQSESLKPLLDRFLLNIQIAYDTCKLGTHLRVDTVSEYELGLVPWRIESATASTKTAFKSLKETCIQLGKILAIQCAQIREQLDAKVDAFVIYMVDPFGDASAMWELCSAFWSLYHAYGQINTGRQDQTQRPDLVLQIIPIRYIASFDHPVVLDASTYFNLAREVYDRCPPSAPSPDKTPLNIYKAPAFQLEEGLPRGIPFKLVSEPPQDLMRENSYMHLAYSISLDGTWVTAAWTDNCGKSQAVVSYHLGTRVFGEVAKEIWQTTIEILQSRRVQWRVCIAKSGSMDREELETWVFLITCPTQVNLFLTLLTVSTDQPYKLTPTSPTTTAQPSTTTPGSTPQPGISPDPTIGLTPAATPSANDPPDVASDPEARLVDTTDETWGVVLAHRLHNSPSTNQFNPALISGLLIKRGETHATSPSPSPTSGPIVVAVNILWIGAVGSTRAATSPFPPSADGVSPGGPYSGTAGSTSGSAPPSPGPGHAQERSTTSLMWTPTVQTRATAENLLKEVLGQYRGLGLLAKLRGMKGTRHGTVPWHVVAAQRGVDGLARVVGGS